MGVTVSLTTMGRVLATIGARRGRAKPLAPCPWSKRRKTRRIGMIKALVESLPPDEACVWEDEVDIDLNPRIGSDWMLPGEQRTVMTPGKNVKRYLAGAMDAKTDRLLGCHLLRPGALPIIAQVVRLAARASREPGQPEALGERPETGEKFVTFASTLALVTLDGDLDTTARFFIVIEVTDPANPTIVGRLETETRTHTVTCDSPRCDYLYSDGRPQGEISIVDMTDFREPAMVRTYRAWPRIRERERPGAYARSVLVNRRRSLLRRSMIVEKHAHMLRSEEYRPDFSEDGLVLWNAIGSLPRRQRAALVLRFYEDLPEAEIAQITVQQHVATLQQPGEIAPLATALAPHRQPPAQALAGRGDPIEQGMGVGVVGEREVCHDRSPWDLSLVFLMLCGRAGRDRLEAVRGCRIATTRRWSRGMPAPARRARDGVRPPRRRA